MKNYDRSIVDEFVDELKKDEYVLVAFWAKICCGGLVEGQIGEWQVRFGKLPGAWYRANVLFALEEELVRINKEIAAHYVEKARREDEHEAGASPASAG